MKLPVQQLPALSWTPQGGATLFAPCSDVSYSGGHAHARNQFPFRAGAQHDPTGREPNQFTVALHFHTTLIGYENQYPENWVAWREALYEGARGDLVHPDLGSLPAVVRTFQVSITPKTLTGVNVTVTFEESQDDEGETAALDDINIKASAKAADAAFSSFDIDYPDGEPFTSIEGAIDSVFGQVNMIEKTISGTANIIDGKVQKFQGYLWSLKSTEEKCDNIINALRTMNRHADAKNDPGTWTCRENANAVMIALYKTRDEAATTKAGRTVRSFVTPADTTLDAVASGTPGNTLEDVLGLNTRLLASPIVPKGTTVKVYA